MYLYYDGIQIEKYPDADGITTNCTLMSGLNYKEFYEANKHHIRGRPISFQVWEDDPDKIIQQIKEIHAIDSSIFVKIPIINSRGEWNTLAIRFGVVHSIPLNITAIYTREQVERTYELLHDTKAPSIVSVFAGPISDTGIDPTPILHYTKQLFQNTTAKLLWAGCREVYTITRAKEAGCDIITIPESVYDKLSDKSKSLEQLSLERVQKFQNDAKKKPTRIGVE
jgi:transaldolase